VIISTVMLPIVWAGLMAQRCFQLNESVQQTLEALDIFRAVAGLPTIRVTEMLHQTTF